MFHGFTRLYADMEQNKKTFNFHQEDIAALAEKCLVCRPVLGRKKFVITNYYSYYVPQNEDDIEWARKVFENNGIEMRVHITKMLGPQGYKCLRARLSDTSKSNNIVAFMGEVKKLRYASFSQSNQNMK